MFIGRCRRDTLTSLRDDTSTTPHVGHFHATAIIQALRSVEYQNPTRPLPHSFIALNSLTSAGPNSVMLREERSFIVK